MGLLREWLFSALQTYFMSTRWLCQPELDSTSPGLSPSFLPKMQLQALANCPTLSPTLFACALYACSYSATVRAHFLSNLLHSNVRKYTSHLNPLCMQSTSTPPLLGMATAVCESKEVSGGGLIIYRPKFLGR